MKADKPLAKRAYGSIAHLPGSKLGQHDKYIHEGQARILTEKTRDRHDVIVVQEKLDGSCVAIAKVDGEIIPLIRAGYAAADSKYPQHHLFHRWAMDRRATWDALLQDGERLVGEWLAQAHSVRYDLQGGRSPFVALDLMRGDERATLEELHDRCLPIGITLPPLLHWGPALSVGAALLALGEHGCYGAQDKAEGVVYRCERDGRVEFLAKFVRQDFEPGRFIPEFGGPAGGVWNWVWCDGDE